MPVVNRFPVLQMKASHISEPRILKLFVVTIMLCTLLATAPAMGARHPSSGASLEAGYSALRLFLEDEQHLTTIRRIKTVLTFKGTSKKTRELIDRIADTSELALEELEQLAAAKPVIVFEEFDDDSIGTAPSRTLALVFAGRLRQRQDYLQLDRSFGKIEDVRRAALRKAETPLFARPGTIRLLVTPPCAKPCIRPCQRTRT